MSKGDDKKIVTAANRATALSALAVQGPRSAGGCLSSDVMAALVAGNLAERERQTCLDHLALCQFCYDEWRALVVDEKHARNKIVKGPWFTTSSLSFTAAGTLLAAAASLILYLNLSPPSFMESQAPVPLVIDSRDSPAEVASDDVPPLKEKVSSPRALQKASRSEAEITEQQESKEKEIAADMERLFQDSAKNDQPVLRPSPMPAVDTFEEEKTMASGLAAVARGDEDMVDIGNVIPVVLKKMSQLEAGESLVLQTYKRDRSLTLVRIAKERILIIEEGFSRAEFEVNSANLAKVLKTLLKKEFPRSNKVRISVGGQADQ